MYEDKEEKKFYRKLWIGTACFTIIIGIFLVAIIHPILIIGTIWDWDINQQLDNANQLAIENSIDEMSLRLTYETGEENDIRLKRAIDVFYNKFGLENTYVMERLENITTIQFTWETVGVN